MKPGSEVKPAGRSKKQRAASSPAPHLPSAKFTQAQPLYLQHLFAANVRQVRKARGISQEELAHRADLDRTYVSSVERRLRNVSIQNIQRLAIALQVDPRDLLDPFLADDPRFSGV